MRDSNEIIHVLSFHQAEVMGVDLWDYFMQDFADLLGQRCRLPSHYVEVFTTQD